jgi:predicted RNA-binding Zn-ribbon protein involved in translation (DUF1610 family)
MEGYKSLKELQEKYKGYFENATVQRAFQIRLEHYDKNHKVAKTAINAGRYIANCRTSKLGGWKYPCECGEEVIMYKSCHNKSCAICNGNENKEWLEFHRERLVNTKYLHIVFVVPEELNDLFLKNKKKMTDYFFKVVKKILKKRCLKLTGGTIMTEHTEGGTITLHPHIHCLVMLGGYDEKNKKFVEIKSSKFKDEEMQAEFKKEYRKGFKKLEKELEKKGKVYIDQVTGFSVWREEKFQNSAEAVLKYFSNSVRGGPISNDQILKVTETKVTFAYKNEQTKNNWEEMELGIDEFIKRILLHIPESRQKQVRKTGVYASSKKNVLEELKELLEGKEVKLETKKEKKKAKREIEEKVSFFCPVCGAKLMWSEEISPVRNESEKIPA